MLRSYFARAGLFGARGPVVSDSPIFEATSGTSGPDSLVGTGGPDTLLGLGGSDTLTGGAGNDYLQGEGGQDTDWKDQGAQRDVLDGGLGSDVLSFGVGDVADGGSGDQSYIHDLGIAYLRGSSVGVVIDVGQSAAGVVQNTGSGGSFVNIEMLDFYGGSGNDRVTGISSYQNTMEGGLGADTLIGGDSEDELTGQDGADSLVGGGARDYLEGGLGDDIVFAGAGDDWAIDFLFHEQGGGDDTIDGGAGDDWVDGRDGDDVVTGGDGNDKVQGEAGADRISGGAGDDQLGDSTDDARDTILGGDGADSIGAEAYDVIDGGTGSADSLSLSFSVYGESRGVTIDISKAAAHIAQALFDGGSVVNVEQIYFYGDGAGASRVTGHVLNDDLEGTRFDDTLSGGAGDDRIWGGYGGDDVIAGGAGNDSLSGYDGIDTITYADARGAVTVDLPNSQATGADGVDYVESFEILIGSRYGDDLTAGYGATTINGGAGSDMIRAYDGGDRLDGGAGDDRVDYSLFAKGVKIDLAAGKATSQGVTDVLVSLENANGSDFADTITGGTGANRLNGGGGDDLLDGGGGSDVLQGGSGVDTVTFKSTTAALTIDLASGAASGGGMGASLASIENAVGGSGADSIRGDDLDNRLDGGDGNDTLLGREANDVLLGGLGGDSLDGGDGFDQMDGGDGSDVLNGGLGADRMAGGAGADVFVFLQIDHAKDLITDLEAGDVINLKAIDANVLVDGDQKFALVSRFTHHAGEARLSYDARKDATLLQLDVDGNGKADMTIKIAGDHHDFTGFVL